MQKWNVSYLVECQECDFEEQGYLTAREAGYRHHKKTGHRVTGEVAYHVEWP